MSVKTKQITIGAAVTQFITTHTPCRQVIVQNNQTHSMRVGDKNTTTSLGIVLAASPSAPVTFGVTGGAPSLNLDDFWVAGTQNDVLDVVYLP